MAVWLWGPLWSCTWLSLPTSPPGEAVLPVWQCSQESGPGTCSFRLSSFPLPCCLPQAPHRASSMAEEEEAVRRTCLRTSANPTFTLVWSAKIYQTCWHKLFIESSQQLFEFVIVLFFRCINRLRLNTCLVSGLHADSTWLSRKFRRPTMWFCSVHRDLASGVPLLSWGSWSSSGEQQEQW